MSPLLPPLAFRPVALPVYGDYPPPPGYVLESKVNKGLIIGGAITWGVSYALGIIYAGANDFEQGLGWAAVPLAGPWIAMASRDYSCPAVTDPLDPNAAQAAADECQTRTVENATAAGVLAGVGVTQLLGATLIAVGVLDRNKQWIRQELVLSGLSVEGHPTPGGGFFRVRGVF